MQDYEVKEDSSRVEEILGTMTGDYNGKVKDPASRVEILLARLKAKLDELEGRVVKIKSIEFKKVEKLPETGEENVVYMIKHKHKDGDFFDEYFYVGGEFELIGNTDIDLSEYVKKVDLSKIATTGSYNDLLDKPFIPSKTSDIENDSDYTTNEKLKAVEDRLTPDTTYTLVKDKTYPHKLVLTDSNGTTQEVITEDTLYDDSKIKEDLNKKAYRSELAAVATSGSYNDLLDIPDLATKEDVTTATKTQTAIEEEKKTLCKMMPDIVSVDEANVPDWADQGKIYLTKQADGSYYINKWDSFNNKFMSYGSVDVDLSKYSKFEAMTVIMWRYLIG